MARIETKILNVSNTAATQLVPADTNRVLVEFHNDTGNKLRIGDSTVTNEAGGDPTAGALITANASKRFSANESQIAPQLSWYGWFETAAGDITVLEVFAD